MFEALKSRYITWFSASCKNDKPLAAPIATLSLIAHDKGSAPPEKYEYFIKMTKFVKELGLHKAEP
jgi:hypothetical protein